MKHNILFLIGTYPSLGGTEKVTTILANKFANDGNNVHIASFNQPLELSRMNLNAKVGFLALSSRVISKKNISAFKHYIKENNIDIIINQWCLPFYVTWFINICKPKGCKVLSALHGMPNRSKTLIVAKDAIEKSSGLVNLKDKVVFNLKNSIIKNSIRYVYRKSDKYILLSKPFISELSEYVGLDCTCKAISIGNPLTIEPLCDNTATDVNESELLYDIIDSKALNRQILYVGRMDKENKRVNRIIEAWERLYNDYPEWSLYLVGDGPHLTELKDYVSRHGIDRVIFHGFVKEDPIEFYRKASILMLTSDLEGFGLVVIEGMSYGVVPVVYGSYSSIYEIIEDSKNGFITPMPYNEDCTIAKLEQLMDSDETLRKMSLNAFESSKKYSIETIAEQWYSIM